MSESSEGPETFYGNRSDKEIREFHNKHTQTVQSPRKSGFLANLFGGRGRRVDYSKTYDIKAMDEATRAPEIFRHKGFEPPPLPEGKFITDRKGRMRRVGE
ncbi:MAG: hypothetical protein NT162_02815 [Candidatus Woesebacteria bacterium]|nr:hypothetical protein [Candidatus Woesebacteria bacterium]